MAENLIDNISVVNGVGHDNDEKKRVTFPDQGSAPESDCEEVNCDGDTVQDATEHPAPLFSEDSAQNVAIKEQRAFKKIKRFHSNSFSHNGPNGLTVNGAPVNIDDLAPTLSKGVHISVSRLPYGKNSRKSRNGLKNGVKKGGAGGKGVWGRPGSELNEIELDVNDPAYDSDNNDPVKLEEVDPVMSQEEFDETVTSWVREYFEHSQAKEMLTNLSEINLSLQQRQRLPYLLINLAVQRKPTQCELTSELLSELCGRVMTGADMQQGFDLILRELPDITLDAPDAPDAVGRFIARAVADDILPPKFVQGYKGRVDCPYAVKSLAKAENLLTLSHAYARLDSVWGVTQGQKATKLLVKKIRLLLEEFLCSGDVEEASRCLHELDSPHFHHELVYQAVLMVIEKSSEQVCGAVAQLLAGLCQSVLVTVDQLEQGLTRVYNEMSDIQLDVPAAYLLLERFVGRGQAAGFISAKMARDMPTKGRKRFVSEGDGGLLKQSGKLLL